MRYFEKIAGVWAPETIEKIIANRFANINRLSTDLAREGAIRRTLSQIGGIKRRNIEGDWKNSWIALNNIKDSAPLDRIRSLDKIVDKSKRADEVLQSAFSKLLDAGLSPTKTVNI